MKNAYALEVERCENLTKELSVFNDSISCLRDENASLNAKIEELNACNVSTFTSDSDDDKKKKLHSRDAPKYTTSDDEGSSSDNEDDLTSLFANLTKDQKKKINELIETINEKDDL